LQRREMCDVLKFFLEWLPMDLGSARDRSASWHDQPIATIKSLRETKNLLYLMKYGAEYLRPDDRKTLDEWLETAPLLP
jgi:hypothetical protein